MRKTAMEQAAISADISASEKPEPSQSASQRLPGGHHPIPTVDVRNVVL